MNYIIYKKQKIKYQRKKYKWRKKKERIKTTLQDSKSSTFEYKIETLGKQERSKKGKKTSWVETTVRVLVCTTTSAVSHAYVLPSSVSASRSRAYLMNSRHKSTTHPPYRRPSAPSGSPRRPAARRSPLRQDHQHASVRAAASCSTSCSATVVPILGACSLDGIDSASEST